MVRFDIVTIFPEIFSSYFQESILKRAQSKNLVRIRVHDLRAYTRDKHRTTDDRPYGGGAGMIVKLEPIYRAVSNLTKFKIQKSKLKITNKNAKIILFSAKGRQFDQRMAEKLAKLDHLILICGRYEGVDERVAKHIADAELSIGPYVLTGGEIPAMVVTDAVTRLVPGVIKEESLMEESFGWSGVLRLASPWPESSRRLAQGAQPSTQRVECSVGEYPHYTRPEVFYPDPKNKRIAWRVPKILMSGDHKKIAEWRMKKMKAR